MSADYCRRCDVFIGSGAVGVVEPPPEASDPSWRESHCWVCKRSADEIRESPR